MNEDKEQRVSHFDQVSSWLYFPSGGRAGLHAASSEQEWGSVSLERTPLPYSRHIC